MKTSGYDVKDQTRRGGSASGKEAGEIDILIEENGLPVTIIEALNLRSVASTYLDRHINKIYNYDTVGNKFNVLLVYVTVADFSAFCDRYRQHVREFNYPYPMIADEDIIMEDFEYSNIKVIKISLNRNNHKTELYHICVLIEKNL